ncbi:hypothetical protein MTO96_027184 [Rhipicephalus appendiculatus]
MPGGQKGFRVRLPVRAAHGRRAQCNNVLGKRGATPRKEGTTRTGASALSPFAGGRGSGRLGATQNESAAARRMRSPRTKRRRYDNDASRMQSRSERAQRESPHAVSGEAVAR